MQRLLGRRFIYSLQDLNFVYGFHSVLLYSTATSPSPSSSTDYFAKYLVNSLGFSPEKALSTSSKINSFRKRSDLNLDANADSVVKFLKKHGFDDKNLRKLVSSCPRLLCANVENTLRPKLQFLLDMGFSGSDLIRAIYVNPNLLGLGVKSSIEPAVEILRQVLGHDSHVIAAIKNIHWLSFSSIVRNLLPNVALLDGYGIPIESIRKQFLQLPGAFLQNPEKFKDVVIRVENNLRITRDSPNFLRGIYLLSHYSEERIESKKQMLKSFGWTQFEVDTFVMKNAMCFTFSDVKVKKKLDYLMNVLQLKPSYLTTNCAFFTCSLENRIMPRHRVLLILKEKGLLTRNPCLSSVIGKSETHFLKKFVLPYKEVHEVYSNLTGCSMKMLTQESASSLS